MERRAEFKCKLEIHRLDNLKEEPHRVQSLGGLRLRQPIESARGLKRTWRNGCLISVVGSEDDATHFLFFEVGTAVFLPREHDIVPAL
ncbi:hypothetical protein GOBAR_AA20051 [Gossypium barbadense]|uniref:Uncharacterized protein n=1 Tax=Gossypium barbadense TaxID=3634 RepID=A0A2P5XB97_GOSBA|nr:hypothetical protein GOBAR_AA20051 [Gossypium barbadense]